MIFWEEFFQNLGASHGLNVIGNESALKDLMLKIFGIHQYSGIPKKITTLIIGSTGINIMYDQFRIGGRFPMEMRYPPLYIHCIRNYGMLIIISYYLYITHQFINFTHYTRIIIQESLSRNTTLWSTNK